MISWGEAAWPNVQGKVLTSSIIKSEIDENDEAWGPGEDPGWDQEMTYEYEVDGVRYESHDEVEIEYGPVGVDERGAREAAKYYVGQDVTIYYDPKSPSNSHLNIERRTAVAGVRAAFLICLAVLLVGAFLIYLA